MTDYYEKMISTRNEVHVASEKNKRRLRDTESNINLMRSTSAKAKLKYKNLKIKKKSRIKSINLKYSNTTDKIVKKAIKDD